MADKKEKTDMKAGAVPALAMDKEQVRQLVLQVANFLKIFGGAYPRLRAVSALLEAEAQPAIWDLIWNALSADPGATKAMAEAFSIEGAAEPTALGTQNDAAAKLLAFVFVPEAPERGADYYNTKSAVAGIIMIAWGFCAMTRTTKDDAAVAILQDLFIQSFDRFYDSQHPAK